MIKNSQGLSSRQHRKTQRMKRCFSSVLFGMVISNTAHALVINATFDSSWLTNAPASATTAINVVDSMLGTLYSNPVTVNINFGWNSIAGTPLATNSLGATTFNNAPLYTLGYIESLMTAYSASHPSNTVMSSVVSHLPVSVSNPGGSNGFFLPEAVYAALTDISVGATNAYVGFGGGFNWQYTQTGGIAAGAYDFVGVALHEITHALGRVSYEFVAPNTPFLTPLDLVRYNCGSTTLNSTSGSTACFSINGGITDLAVFSPTSDSADLNGATIDPFNAFMSSGTTYTMTSLGNQMMQSIGWTLSTAVPEPGTVYLIGVSFIAMIVARRRKMRPGSGHPAWGAIGRSV